MGCKNVSDQKSRHRQNDNKKGEIITKKEHIERKEDGTIVKTIIEERVIIDDGTNKKAKPKQEKYQDSSPQHSKDSNLNLNSFRKEALAVHNDYRLNHNAPPLKINSKLNDIAQKYAEELAKRDTMVHSKNKMEGQDLGENLFMCGGYLITGKDMTKSWYDEIYDYNFKKPEFKSGTGHFTQVVWVGSKEVGFGAAKSKSGNYYGVANYFPPGNFLGEFEENVLRKK